MRTDQPIRFEYFGWTEFDQKYHPDQVAKFQPPSWNSKYDAALTRIQPEQLRIYNSEFDLYFDLPRGHVSLLDMYLAEKL